eukprot:4003798-Amphidinium_carterae.1
MNACSKPLIRLALLDGYIAKTACVSHHKCMQGPVVQSMVRMGLCHEAERCRVIAQVHRMVWGEWRQSTLSHPTLVFSQSDHLWKAKPW